jgi:hypothetical protein
MKIIRMALVFRFMSLEEGRDGEENSVQTFGN